MANKEIILSKTYGSLEFDFDDRTVTFVRSARSLSLGFKHTVLSFDDITAVEYGEKSFFEPAEVIFLVNDTRYVHAKSNDIAMFGFWNINPNYISNLEKCLKLLKEHNNIIKLGKKNQFSNLPKVSLTSEEFELLNKKDVLKMTEVMKKCRVCGKIFCYNLEDMMNNERNLKSAKLSMVGAVVGAVGGTNLDVYANSNNVQKYVDKIVDFNRCPNCNSTDLIEITKEEFETFQNNQVQPQQSTISAADELKKFKELLDLGIITQEEFDAKKKQLLGL